MTLYQFTISTHHAFRSFLGCSDISDHSSTDTDVSLGETTYNPGHHKQDKIVGDGPNSIGETHPHLNNRTNKINKLNNYNTSFSLPASILWLTILPVTHHTQNKDRLPSIDVRGCANDGGGQKLEEREERSKKTWSNT